MLALGALAAPAWPGGDLAAQSSRERAALAPTPRAPTPRAIARARVRATARTSTSRAATSPGSARRSSSGCGSCSTRASAAGSAARSTPASAGSRPASPKAWKGSRKGWPRSTAPWPTTSTHTSAAATTRPARPRRGAAAGLPHRLHGVAGPRRLGRAQAHLGPDHRHRVGPRRGARPRHQHRDPHLPRPLRQQRARRRARREPLVAQQRPPRHAEHGGDGARGHARERVVDLRRRLGARRARRGRGDRA